MFEGYYTKALWGGKGVWRSSRGFRADTPIMPIVEKKAIFGGLPWTPLKTSKLIYPPNGLWYSTPQTYVKIKLIALLLLWFLRDKPFWSVSPLILYTINFEVRCRTLNIQKVGFFVTWWNILGQMNGIRHLQKFFYDFWHNSIYFDTP